jgi:hypothetical protein
VLLLDIPQQVDMAGPCSSTASGVLLLVLLLLQGLRSL